MKRLLLPLLPAIALPTAVNAESYWLFLRSTHASGGPALEKIEMESMDQCEEQGKRWLEDAQGREAKWRKYFCFEGK